VNTSTQPGWYPDQYGRDRWWDGQQWTDQVKSVADLANPTQRLRQQSEQPVRSGSSSAWRRSRWPWLVGTAVGSWIVGLLMGMAGNGGQTAVSTVSAGSTPVSTTTTTVYDTMTIPATTVTVPEPAGTVTVEAQADASSDITEGTWTVGVDIKPGTYRVITAVDQQCYWSITKSGTNGDDIVANDIVTGGRPTVKLKKGQDFTNTGCGDWSRVGG
jgi:hypothetical protein